MANAPVHSSPSLLPQFVPNLCCFIAALSHRCSLAQARPRHSRGAAYQQSAPYAGKEGRGGTRHHALRDTHRTPPHTNTHARTRARTHKHALTRVHAAPPTPKHTHTHARPPARPRTRAHARAYTQTFTPHQALVPHQTTVHIRTTLRRRQARVIQTLVESLGVWIQTLAAAATPDGRGRPRHTQATAGARNAPKRLRPPPPTRIRRGSRPSARPAIIAALRAALKRTPPAAGPHQLLVARRGSALLAEAAAAAAAAVVVIVVVLVVVVVVVQYKY